MKYMMYTLQTNASNAFDANAQRILFECALSDMGMCTRWAPVTHLLVALSTSASGQVGQRHADVCYECR